MLNKIVKLKDGSKLGYSECGDLKGKPLFYFHGWPGSRLSGLETDEAGKKLGVRIISPDRPGIGLSDYKENRTLLDWPDDVIELAEMLKIKKFAVMGCSGGGPYVAVCAYKLSDRITKAGIVVGLAPVNIKGNLDGMAFQSKFAWANYHRLPILRTIAALGAAMQFKYFPFLGSLIAFHSREDSIFFKSLMKNQINKRIKEAFRQGIKGAELELKIYTDNWGFKLKDIKTKVYLWYGGKDKCVSSNMGKYYQAQIPNSKLFIDPNGGHLFRYNIEEKILKKLVS